MPGALALPQLPFFPSSPSRPCGCWCIQFSTTQTTTLLCLPLCSARLKLTPPIAPLGRSAPKNPVNRDSRLFFFFLFYSLGLSSEDLGSLGELRMSEAFRELWAVSVKFLLSALFQECAIRCGTTAHQVSPLERCQLRHL